MKMDSFPFAAVDWSKVEPREYPGERGRATWRTLQFGDIRVRLIEYSKGYLADHWCEKGHVVLCIEGQLETELKDGRVVTLQPGMSYAVGDGAMPHRSQTETGARLFIVD